MKRPSLRELLFPSKCVLCTELLTDRSHPLCCDCRTNLTERRKYDRKIPFAKGTAVLWSYEDQVRGSLLRFKFGRKRHYAHFYGQALADKLQREQIPFDVITWVPVSRLRRLQRGYDQVQLIAQVLARQLGSKEIRCLRKIRNNPPQSGIVGEAQRRANVLGVYRAVNTPCFYGKRVLLLDDIITTGATISESAKVLMTAGAKEVYCAAIAAAKNTK